MNDMATAEPERAMLFQKWQIFPRFFWTALIVSSSIAMLLYKLGMDRGYVTVVTLILIYPMKNMFKILFKNKSLFKDNQLN